MEDETGCFNFPLHKAPRLNLQSGLTVDDPIELDKCQFSISCESNIEGSQFTTVHVTMEDTIVRNTISNVETAEFADFTVDDLMELSGSQFENSHGNNLVVSHQIIDPVDTNIVELNEINPTSNVVADMHKDQRHFIVEHSVNYLDIGDPIHACKYCGAIFWYNERIGKHYRAKDPMYSGCCTNGKIKLPEMKNPPKILEDLIFGNDAKSKHFLANIRSYNSMFSFTSMGGKIDKSLNTGRSPPIFRLHGQNYHSIGSLLPAEGCQPRFAQLYIYDTENEITNRLLSVRQENNINSLHDEIVADLKDMLDTNNVLVKSFRMAKNKFLEHSCSNIKLRLIGKRGKDGRRYNLPTVSEVAALIVGDFDESMGDRDIVLETKSGHLKRINELHASYLALQYPLLFPYGEDGYREDIPYSGLRALSNNGRKRVSFREFFAYRLHERHNEPLNIMSSKRLFQQFIVDSYTMIESNRLTYIRTHQKELRAEMYKGLTDAVIRGETDPTTQGKRIILPSSFTGGARYMIQNYQDAMAICSWIGYPDLFITFTCNPKWPEITRYCEDRGLKPEDRPDIIVRVFKMKLDNLIKDVRHNKIFGTVAAVIYTIEFQKRGLPHAHILLFLSKENKHPAGEDIDKIISAEIPDKEIDPDYYQAVQDYMIHGPCGITHKDSPCMVNGRCSKFFPKKFVNLTTTDEDGYPVYRRRDNGHFVEKNGVPLDNRYVVPHNHYLLMKYGGHINVEWCNQSRSIKYLFKYINKGHDRVTASFYESTGEEETKRKCDEVQMYYDCRYISPCETAWRIFGYEMQYRDPAVERLSFHLSGEQSIIFSDTDPIDVVIDRETFKQSKFMAWMEANKIYPEARKLTYSEFPTKFVSKKDIRAWEPRKVRYAIGRLFYVPPGSGELYYLRCLLNVVRGPTSYEDIKCINGVQYATFRDACYALGLLEDDKEYIDGIIEASQWATAKSLRYLFVTLLSAGSLARPEEVWDKCWSYLSEDIVYNQRISLGHPGLTLDDPEVKKYALVEMEKLLRSLGKSLNDFDCMPFPEERYFQKTSGNSIINEELRYNRKTQYEDYHDFLSKCTDEQRCVHDTILEAVNSSKGGLFFVYGYGGTGKTFVWKGLSAALRSKGEIVINVASSGIASLLLPGGRTAHSRFKIPIDPNEDSTCNISQGSPLAELIIRAKLIIWDEAPMTHKFCFEALDRSCRDIMCFTNPDNFNSPFGGKTVVLGGDFRQILPVIPKGSRQDIVNATINSSYLWSDCTILKLTKNLRIQNATTIDESNQFEEFGHWIATIGDGTNGCANDGEAIVDIPSDLLLKYSNDPIATIGDHIYESEHGVYDSRIYLQDRAILAPTLAVVEKINQYMVSLNEEEGRSFFSSDSTCTSNSNGSILSNIHTPEFLNTLKCSGVPNHDLYLKVGTPVMLLRNIDHAKGLCNGTRLVITKLGSHVLEAEVLTGHSTGNRILIPRLSLTPSDPRLPFKFQRRQFPLIVSYAMTINKSQGQSLKRVGLLLKNPVFSHGQLYVAISRATCRSGLKILICKSNDTEDTSTQNVVFKEVFRNV